jgi:hypothetical protein
MAKTSLHTVSLRQGFGAPQRTRAGRTFLRGTEYVLELDNDQLKALKEDSEFNVADAPEGATVNEAGYQVGTNPPEAPEAGEDTTTGEAETPSGSDEGAEGSEAGSEAEGDSGAESEGEAGSGEDTTSEPQTVDSLVQNHSREELDNMAREAGVEKPEDLANKQEVAEAILGQNSEA